VDLLVKKLIDLGFTLSSCESLTGGLFSASLTSVPGVSAVFKGGLVTYWNEIKVNVAGVCQKTVDDYGVVSSQTAREMAQNVAGIFHTDIGVSFTGNAGPDTLEGKPKGLVYTCIAIKGEVHEFEDLIDLPRNELRLRIVELTGARLMELLNKEYHLEEEQDG
jgi:PncC family amidohydrolase